MLPLSWGCFGSLVWKTCYIPKLWGIVEALLLLFHLASLSSTMDNTTYSLFQHGSLCAENIPPERWLMPQITFCCVHSTHRKWWEFRLTHPQVPSLYISSFLFFFFFPFSRSSTDSKAQSLQSKKQSWVSHGVQGQDGLSIPNSAGRQQDTSGISFPHGGPAAQGEERWMLHRPCCVRSKSSCFYSPLEECRGGHTSRAGPVKQQFPQQAPPITPGDSLNVV